MNFPNLKPSYELSIERENNVISSKKENGIVQTRQRYTKTRKTYNLTFSALHKADRDTLTNFYDTNASLSFAWFSPIENNYLEVRFSEPIKETLTAHNIYKITCKLVEV